MSLASEPSSAVVGGSKWLNGTMRLNGHLMAIDNIREWSYSLRYSMVRMHRKAFEDENEMFAVAAYDSSCIGLGRVFRRCFGPLDTP